VPAREEGDRLTGNRGTSLWFASGGFGRDSSE
jgi:hypothetical protein